MNKQQNGSGVARKRTQEPSSCFFSLAVFSLWHLTFRNTGGIVSFVSLRGAFLFKELQSSMESRQETGAI